MNKKAQFLLIVFMGLLTITSCSSSPNPPNKSSITPSPVNTLTHTLTSLPPSPSKTPTKTITPSPTQTLTSTPYPTYTPAPTQPVLPVGDILFADDFETDIANEWMFNDIDSWKIQEDENGNRFLCVLEKSIREGNIRIGDESWENYQLSFDMKDKNIFPDGGLSISFMKNDEEYYVLGLDFTILSRESVWNVSTEESMAFFAKDPGGKAIIRHIPKVIEDQWHSVLIRASKGDISIYWDNILLFELTDDDYLSAGFVRFGVVNGSCLDNVQVSTINAEK